MDPTRLKRGPKRSGLACLAANDDEPEDGENNAPGHGKISGASSGKSTCQKARSVPHDGVLDAGFGDGGGGLFVAPLMVPSAPHRPSLRPTMHPTLNGASEDGICCMWLRGTCTQKRSHKVPADKLFRDPL